MRNRGISRRFPRIREPPEATVRAMDRSEELEVLAAGFSESGQAGAVRALVADAFDMRPEDLNLDALAATDDHPGELTVVLAGRFRHRQLPIVTDVVEHHGGVVLTILPVSRTGLHG